MKSHPFRTVQKPEFLTRFPNVNAKKRYGFTHGFKVVRDGFRNHPQYFDGHKFGFV